MYTTTVNNYRGLTTGGMSVDCPHRERRGCVEEKRREERTLCAVTMCGVWCVVCAVCCVLCAAWYCMLIPVFLYISCPSFFLRYGGDAHTSYQFALANYPVGAFFNKWTRDFADVQVKNNLLKQPIKFTPL
jgi:hypothetical protein